ncbi:hypothetical protein [Synechococcus sp. CS-205]|jgi:hypothetical protein|uniref:hypothetical protein n=1 Tax=Synechococcus sp. CS-205 TaxID=2847984 RepID=UPI00223C3FB0|nr:hypothetical protein [Synechococcus sp. CS-205]
MTAIPTDPRQVDGRRALRGWGLMLVLALSGCAAEPLGKDGPRLREDQCLDEVRVDALDQALERCDRVVDTFPRAARPLSDRFVLHTLRGDHGRACQDIEKAAALLRSASDGKPSAPEGDPQLVTDIRVRQESCRDIPAAASP